LAARIERGHHSRREWIVYGEKRGRIEDRAGLDNLNSAIMASVEEKPFGVNYHGIQTVVAPIDAPATLLTG
jgi:hypothetical protein